MLRSYEEVAEAIKKMVVRGAPAIGVSAAMGLRAWRQPVSGHIGRRSGRRLRLHVQGDVRDHVPRQLTSSGRSSACATRLRRERALTKDPLQIKERLIEEALNIFREDIEANRALGRFGAELLSDGDTVLTHCNAGALATAGDLRHGARRRPRRHRRRKTHRSRYADETRPFLQGLRLTAWELAKDNIPVTVDYRQYGRTRDEKWSRSMRWWWARIESLANGDAANKIGTYMVAVLRARAQHPVLCRGARVHARPCR